MKPVFRKCAVLGGAPKQARIGFILGKQEGRKAPVLRGTHGKEKFSQCFVRRLQQVRVLVPSNPRLERAPFMRATPRPGVAKPNRRQQMQRCCFGPAIGRGDANQNVVRRVFGIFSEDVEVSAIVENSSVRQLELRLVPAAPAIFLDQPRVGIFRLRIFVERLQVGVRRRRIEVEILLLHVLAMIPLAAGEAEQALFQNRVAPIPERERETKPALTVGDAEQPVLAPAVSAASSLFMGKIFPARAARRIVLTHRGPLALAEIRSPPFPVLRPRGVLLQSDGFSRFRFVLAHGTDSGI